jgi:hypothetical protein
LQSRFTTNVSPGFPLRKELPYFLSQGQLFLSDQEIWMHDRKK